MGKSIIDVVQDRATLSMPSAREVNTAVSRLAGKDVKLRETYVKLSPQVPYVAQKGALVFSRWEFINSALDYARGPVNAATNPALEIYLYRLQVGATYALVIHSEVTPTAGAKPQLFLEWWSNTPTGVTPGGAAMADVKPQHVVATVITPTQSGPVTVEITPSALSSSWKFYSAILYAP